MQSVRIYISGPTTGYHNFNREAFFDAGVLISNAIGESTTVEFVNPAVFNAQNNNYNWEECMKIALAQLTLCDYIYMLEGWEISVGACTEKMIAGLLKIQEIKVETSEGVPKLRKINDSSKDYKKSVLSLFTPQLFFQDQVWHK